MENNLENKLSMYQKVQGFLTLNASSMTSLPIVATLKTQLDTKVNAILSVASKAGADLTGFTVDKQLKRDDLKTKTLKLSTAIVAHSAITGNFKLLEKCDETSAMIDKMRDNDFYTYAQLIISEATPIMASLTPYGVVAADLTAATTSATTYLSVIQAPRVQINERSRALEDINDLFEDMDKFLREKLDQVMKLYVVQNPSLYTGYQGSRSIDETGSATSPDYMGTVGTNQIKVIATLPYLASRSFQIENNGNVAFNFSLSSSTTALEGTILNLEPGQYLTRLTTNLNLNEAATQVLIQNQNTEQSASFKIWIVE